MNRVKNIYVDQMERYLSFINTLPREEIVRLEKKEIDIRFYLVPNSKNKTNKKPIELSSKVQIDADLIIAKLHKINNRVEGEKYLLSKCSNRVELESVAKKLDVPFQKKDNMERLKDKIIEGTIGYRLRSQAIQS